MESDPDLLHISFTTLFFPLQLSPVMGVALAVVMIVVLLLCSALISSSEVAFFSLTPNDVKLLEGEGSGVSKRILGLREMPRKLLATILISNNFINIAIVLLSDFVLRNLLSEAMLSGWSERLLLVAPWLPFSVGGLANFINIALTVAGVTFLLVLFGEVAPKIYAKLNNLKLAKFMSRPLLLLTKMLSPLSRILVNGTNLIERRLEKRNSNASSASKEDIDQAIELTVKNTQHSKQEIDILKGIVKFGDVAVKQVMRSRMEVVALDFRTKYTDLLKMVKDCGYSRIPVYDGDFDSLTGLLYAKDLLGHLDEGDDYEWQSLIRTQLLYVPESKKIDDLLREFQAERMHMAIVVDEYGGSSGIATLEDIMEEIVGEIRDEFDDETEIDFDKIDEYNYIFEGRTLLNDVCRVIGEDTTLFDEIRGDADSVAGLILELMGQIPKKNAEIACNGFLFRIVSVSKRRIEKIQVTLPIKKV